MSALTTTKHAAERAIEPLERRLRPFYRFLFRAGRRLSRHAGPDGHDMAPGVMITQKDEVDGQLHLWVGAFLHSQPTTELRVRVRLSLDGGEDVHATEATLTWFDMTGETVVSGWDQGSRLFHRHVAIPTDDLARDAEYVATAEVMDIVDPAANQTLRTARCRVRLLPRSMAVGSTLRMVVGSCYDAYTDAQARVPEAYAAHVPHRLGGRPDLTLLLGDQVYADTPWWSYLLQARAVPRTATLLEYWASWGLQLSGGPATSAGSGLGPLLTDGPTCFLPDDHEFWNNWPHASVTAKHSFLNQARGLLGGLARTAAAARDLVHEPHPVVPADPGEVPEGATERNHLPVHPDEWGAWSRAAFDLFGSFQTRSVRDRRDGTITRGEYSDDPERDPQRPPRDGAPGVIHQPLTPPVQHLDLDPLHLALLDTRTRRTRSRTNARFSRFVDDRWLDQVLERAGTAPLFVLAMPEPAFQAPAPWRLTLPGTSDYGIRHYTHQYVRFWHELVERRAGRPTVLLGGDIHRSYVAHSLEHAIVQVVASPFSLVYGSRYSEMRTFRDETGPPPAGHLENSWPPAERVIALRGHPDHRDGFAGLALTRVDADHYDLTISLLPVNQQDEVLTAGYRLATSGPDIGVRPFHTA